MQMLPKQQSAIALGDGACVNDNQPPCQGSGQGDFPNNSQPPHWGRGASQMTISHHVKEGGLMVDNQLPCQGKGAAQMTISCRIEGGLIWAADRHHRC